MRHVSWLFCAALASCGTSGGQNDGGKDEGGSDAGDAAADAPPMCTGVDLTTDVKNCGACAHDCGGGECKSGVCQPVRLVPLSTIGYGIAIDDQAVFWTSPFGGIFSCPKTGCANPISISAGGVPTFIAVDTTNVYWGEYAGSPLGPGLHTCLKTGCMQSMIGAGTEGEGVAVDQGMIYWADHTSQASGIINTCSAPSCGSPKPLATGAFATVGVAVDAANVYFTNAQSPSGSILVCAKGGCVQPTVLASAEHNPIGIAVDTSNVYWTDFNDGKVASCAKTGCNMMPTALAAMQPNPFGIVADEKNVYWVNVGASKGSSADGSLVYCAKTGCGGMPTTLLPNLTGPETVAQDPSMLYIVTAIDVVKIAKPAK